MIEQWKPVVGYEGLYEVSDLGKVRSLGAITNWSRWKHYAGSELKGTLTKRGYRQFCLRDCDGAERSICGHVIVAAAFLGPRPDGKEICHADGNGDNNKLTNLRYDVPQGNAADRIRHGRMPTRASGHRRAKLTDMQVHEIRQSSEKGVALAKRYGVSPQLVSELRKGHGWAKRKGRWQLREVELT